MSFPLPFDNLVLRNYKNLTNDQLETIRKVFCSALVHMQIKYKMPIRENIQLIQFMNQSEIKYFKELLDSFLVQVGFDKIIPSDILLICIRRIVPNKEFGILKI